MWTAFHPEMDSSSEHSNKTTMEALYHYINTHQNDWSNYLVHVEMAMNNLINATMNKLPMELLYRTYIRLIFHQVDTFNAILYRQQLPDKINESIWITKDYYIAKTYSATQANCHHCPEPVYKTGDLVYLNTVNL